LQRRWQDGCRNLALVGSRLGVRYMLYPGGFLTQRVGCVKRLSTFALNSLPRSPDHGEEEQATPAKKAAAGQTPLRRSQPFRNAAHQSDGRSGCRRYASAFAFAFAFAGRAPDRTITTASAGSKCEDVAGRPSAPGCLDPTGARPLLSLRPAADRDHGRPDVRAADRRIDRAA
jgi:hypothetical protein